MRAIRHFSLITRLVLAWFVLSLGVAVASPIVKPQDLALVCSGAGPMKIVAQADDGSSSDASPTTMDCPLCLPLAAPLITTWPLPEPGRPAAHVAPVPADPLHGGHTAAALPARGPPLL